MVAAARTGGLGGQARGCHNVTIGTLEIDIAMFDELLVKVS
jgi:hypothetical protein